MKPSLKPTSEFDDYCSRIDDELRATEVRSPIVGLVVFAASASATFSVVYFLIMWSTS